MFSADLWLTPQITFTACGALSTLADPTDLWVRGGGAPVVQWIECWPPKPKIWVRLPAGAPFFARRAAVSEGRPPTLRVSGAKDGPTSTSYEGFASTFVPASYACFRRTASTAIFVE